MDLDSLREKYQQERDKRLRPDGNDQYLRLTGQLAHYLDDPYTPVVEREPKTDHVTAAFIGGGFAGLITGARLKEAGVDVRIIEKGGDFGGTWYWNRYPGAMCDTASFVYMLRRLQGRLHEFLPMFEMLASDDRAPGAWSAAQALALAETEDPSAASTLHEAVARLPDIPKDWLWLGSVTLLADACVKLGDRRAAPDLYRALWPHRAEAAVSAHGVALLGPVKPRLDALSKLAEGNLHSAR